MEESKTAEDNLVFVEGMQFDRGYYSPYFVTDPERMVCAWGRQSEPGSRLSSYTNTMLGRVRSVWLLQHQGRGAEEEC
jgi:hypothetical protein